MRTSDSLRELAEKLYPRHPGASTPGSRAILAHADAWEADNYAHAVEVAAKDVLIAALRKRLEEAEALEAIRAHADAYDAANAGEEKP